MHWRQVCLIAQAFAATKQGATYSKIEPVFSIYAQAEPVGDALVSLDTVRQFQHLQPRVQVLPKFKDFSIDGAWLVRRAGARVGGHMYLPAVNTAQALRDALEAAWEPPNRVGCARGS